jgi:hypothetical protein
MNGKTRRQLIAVIIVAIVVVAAVWYAVSRQRHYAATTLTSITYIPASASGAGPYLTFTFSAPLPAQSVAGTSAVLKSFAVDATSPTPATFGVELVNALVAGAPFVPDPQSDPAVITTNTLPANAPASPMALSGVGTMWFIVPTRA